MENNFGKVGMFPFVPTYNNHDMICQQRIFGILNNFARAFFMQEIWFYMYYIPANVHKNTHEIFPAHE